jgi:hypothetical protein
VETLAEVLARLDVRGYRADFVPEQGGVRCAGCAALLAPDDLRVDEIVRLEGDSDPDDEVIVYALSCGPCGKQGTFVAPFGAAVSAAEADLIAVLRSRHA